MFYFLFWLSLVFLGLGTILYPLLLWLAARVKFRPVQRNASCLPRLSVVIGCRNEEEFIARKIHNLLELDYPADRLEVVLVSDGSTDRTEVIIDLFLPHPQLRLIALPQSQGDAQAWNTGAAAATGEVLVFTDARQLLKPDSFRALTASFADTGIGGVTGARIELSTKDETGRKRRKKIKLKDLIRRLRYAVKTWETHIHSVTEVNEALFACRKELYRPLPAAFALPGFAALRQVVGQGYRVVFEPRALLYDTARYPLRREIERYGRIFFGYFQYLFGEKTAFTGTVRPIWWQLTLHNWVRLCFPVLFLVLFVSNLFIAKDWFYNSILLAQLLLIGVSLLSIVFRKPLLFYLASRFNTLVILSFYDFLTRSPRPAERKDSKGLDSWKGNISVRP
jgi:glycosyltransferase involved in cell wall biosynthesis